MNDPENSFGELNPNSVLAQSAALARHLQASGVEFLPAARTDVAAEIVAQYEASLPATPVPAETTSQATASATQVSEPRTAPLTKPAPSAKQAPSAKKTPSARPAPIIVADSVEVSYAGEPLALEQREQQLQVLSEQVAGCTRCEKLAPCRLNTVFGEGSAKPRVAFFGEGPGADEDRTGRPFVGKAGQLLTKMIEACSFQREDVYILNSVKCRPPGNRNPEPDELNNCREFYENQLQILRPEYIVCLGAVSSQALLQSKLSVGRLRGKFHRYFDSKVLVTYHPAYLLRNPAAKKAAWQDLQLMLRDAGII